ncbi:MAG TPA: type I restriction enzyme HsdR N-terminal domain-containing protein [Verrucomicrobiae bacterium]|nr:type I restriction enzyme HsdR N-terminal domain-containing protein [Verrucomicrobiae bacterium]
MNRLEDTVSDIVARLRQGRYPNEQSISQGIVLRLLQDLGWDVYDTTCVWPEYQTGEGRADFALCHPPSKPSVFIEIKQPGIAEDPNAVRQALLYAFQTGVTFIVLTDGKTWSFYLPVERGSYEDRRVYKLDLFERQPAAAARTLAQYLSRNLVISGEAIASAKREYESKNRRSEALAAMPAAWDELVSKGEETLLELLATEVETKSGFRPNDEDINAFLASLSPQTIPVPDSSMPPKPARGGPRSVVAAPEVIPAPTASQRAGVLQIQGKAIRYNNAKDAMVTVLRMLAKKDPTFLQRCAQHPDNRGRKRAYIARTAEELYPDRPDLREHHESLDGGWLVATNLNNALKKTIIQLACDVAGITFGKDVVIQF